LIYPPASYRWWNMTPKVKLHGIVKTIYLCSRAKDLERRGWVLVAGVQNPESVADHSFSVSVAVAFLGDALGMDTLKLVRMALIHDVCEVMTGDLQPGEVSKEEKRRLERSALARLLKGLPPQVRRTYLTAFEEFNRGRTREAVLAREVDKLEMVLQAIEYEKEGVDPKRLKEFWRAARIRLRTPLGRSLFKVVAGLRPRR